MKDFSRQPRVVEFKINEDVFRGKPYLAAQTMIDFTLGVDKLGDDISAQQGFDIMSESLQLVLMPDSYKRFRDRMRDPSAGTSESADAVLDRIRGVVLQATQGGSVTVPVGVLAEALDPQDRVEVDAGPNDQPIELPQVNEIIEWIMEEYGMRPPTSPADSSTGPSVPGSGMNSTVSVPAGV